MIRRTLALVSLTLAVATTAHAQEAPPATFDCGLITGLSIAAETLSASQGSRAMNVDGWLAKFEANTARQDKLSIGIEGAMATVVTASTRSVLNAIKLALDSTVRTGRGDAYYWRDMVNAQFRSYEAMADSLNQLKTATCAQ